MLGKSKLLSIPPKHVWLFYILLAAVWIGESGEEILHSHVSAGLLLLVFGSLFLLVMNMVQNYFVKMLLVYQKNLNNSPHLKNRR